MEIVAAVLQRGEIIIKIVDGELLNFIAKTFGQQKFNLLNRRTSKAAGFGQDEGTTEKYIYIETYNHKYFSGGFRCAFCVWVFLPGGIRPANAKLYNFYVWSLFFLSLLIAFPSLSCVCVWESVKIR